MSGMDRAEASLFAIVVANSASDLARANQCAFFCSRASSSYFLVANLVELADEIGSKRAIGSGLRTGHDSLPKNLNVISRAPETRDAVPIAATQGHGNPECSVGQLTQRRNSPRVPGWNARRFDRFRWCAK